MGDTELPCYQRFSFVDPPSSCARLRVRLICGVGPTNSELREGPDWRNIQHMSIDEVEAAALRLEPKARARLAGRLLESLEEFTPDENARLWAEFSANLTSQR